MTRIYLVNIDFDEASREWNRNKKRVDQSYVYICGAVTKQGSYCQNKRYKNCNFCYAHRKKKIN